MPSWKKIILSGSDASLNSLSVSNGITGSLFGTSSWAVSASRALTSSYITSSNVYGPYGSNSILSASYGVTSSYAVAFYASQSLTASGLIYPTADNGEESFIQTNGAGALSLQYVKTIYEEIVNGESTQLVKGTPVYVSGSVGAASIVFRADASNSAKMPVVYVSADTINPGGTGRGIALGLIKGVNTTGYPAGTEIYVGVGGGWTSTRPTGSTVIIQVLGYVTKEGSGGQGVILNPGPANLPNLQNGYIWVGNSTNYPTAVQTSSIQNVVSSSFSTTSSYALTASYVQTAQTASYVLNAVSASYASSSTSASYALTTSFALNAFPYTGSARITGSLGITGSVSISSGSLNITNVNGTNILNTLNYALSNNIGSTTVSWNDNILYDSSIKSVDWKNKILNDQAISVDWKNRILHDQATSSSINWDTREANDLSNAISIDWGQRVLRDSFGEGVLDWENRTFEGTASIATIASFATITDSASYKATASNIDYPLAIFNGPIISSSQSNSGSFIIGAIDQPLYFNPNTGVLTTRTFSGALIGTASFAVTASYALSGGVSFPYTGSAIITGSLVTTGSVRGQVINITPNNQTASLNCALGNIFTLTLSSSVNTILTASNIQPGQAINLRIVQPNPSGSLTYGSQFKFSSGFAYTASTTSSVTDIISFLTFDTSSLFGTSIRNFI
jgi:hypothetical protein